MSEIDSFLLTNAAPSSAAQNLIRGVISSIGHEISQLDSTISALKLVLSEYQIKRTTKITQQSRYTRILSPLRCMPLEVLGEIFLYACAQEPLFRGQISQVCQLWRRAALASSELWSTIHVKGAPKTETLMKEYLKTCVDRSRSYSLTLQYEELDYQYDEFQAILDVTGTAKWKEIDWTCFAGPLNFSQILALTVNSFDTLECFILEDASGFRPLGRNAITLDLKATSRCLQNLTILLPYHTRPYTIEADWSQITHLHLQDPSMDQKTTLDILLQCLNLKACILGVPHFGRDNSRKVPIMLPQLSRLELEAKQHEPSILELQTKWPSILNVLGHVLVTPAIETLVINVDPSYEFKLKSHTDTRFKHYLEVCGTTLRRLEITGIRAFDVKKLIAQSPLLESLVIHLVSKNDIEKMATYLGQSLKTIELFMVPQTESPKIVVQHDGSSEGEVGASLPEALSKCDVIPFPHLRHLSIVGVVSPYVQHKFIKTIRSRWWVESEDLTCIRPCARLRSASLKDSFPKEGNYCVVQDEVRELEEQGLKLDIMPLYKKRSYR